jgi:hypothetical protein
VELADGNLITFRNGHDLRSLYPPECSKYIRITAWATVFRLRKQDSTNKTSSRNSGGPDFFAPSPSRFSDVPDYWSLEEPVVEDSRFEFFRMLKTPDDPTDINCVGVLMGWDTRMAHGREHELDAKFLLVEAKTGCYERVGICSYQSPSALELKDGATARLGELKLQRQTVRLG